MYKAIANIITTSLVSSLLINFFIVCVFVVDILISGPLYTPLLVHIVEIRCNAEEYIDLS